MGAAGRSLARVRLWDWVCSVKIFPGDGSQAGGFVWSFLKRFSKSVGRRRATRRSKAPARFEDSVGRWGGDDGFGRELLMGGGKESVRASDRTVTGKRPCLGLGLFGQTLSGRRVAGRRLRLVIFEEVFKERGTAACDRVKQGACPVRG